MTDGAVARPADSPHCGPGERVSRIIGQSPADSRTDVAPIRIAIDTWFMLRYTNQK